MQWGEYKMKVIFPLIGLLVSIWVGSYFVFEFEDTWISFPAFMSTAILYVFFSVLVGINIEK